ELDQHMFTLACANMIFRGDGKANMFWDDCLNPRESSTTQRITSLKPTVSMLNPPYSKKAKGKRELSFVKKAADLTIPGGLCLAIIPVNAINDDKKEIVSLKEEILQNHTLKAVMSMPPQLFPGVGTVTAIVVLETHKPHYKSLRDSNGKPVPKQNTWFGYWRDDGFTVNKNKRVEREEGIWNRIKSEWLDSYVNQEVYPGKSCKAAVTHLDEWVAEAYMETDYSLLTEKEFEQEIKKFALFNLMLDVEGASDLGEDNESQ
ncbi:TPA: N-6 DNA methylase, partial [Klebsiella pneumoniae]|nr:N-6 DNA methylase [Klebsiella pneumoniae]